MVMYITLFGKKKKNNIRKCTFICKWRSWECFKVLFCSHQNTKKKRENEVALNLNETWMLPGHLISPPPPNIKASTWVSGSQYVQNPNIFRLYTTSNLCGVWKLAMNTMNCLSKLQFMWHKCLTYDMLGIDIHVQSIFKKKCGHLHSILY